MERFDQTVSVERRAEATLIFINEIGGVGGVSAIIEVLGAPVLTRDMLLL